MGRYTVVLALLAALAVTAGLSSAAATREWACVNFREPVQIGKYFLMGPHLIVHDQDKMAQGQPCTYIYEGNQPRPEKLVVSFHCRPIARNAASLFTISVRRSPDVLAILGLQEFQFAGSSEGHGVPRNESQ